MKWMYKIQQRIAITETESWALIVLIGLFGLGLTVREVQKHSNPIPDGFYAVPDSMFVTAVPRREASTNQVEPTDSTQLHVTVQDTSKSKKQKQSNSDGDVDEKVQARMNLNTATASQLVRLPGIGPALAERILSYRTQNGLFGSVDDLLKVKGIGAKKLEKMRLLLFVEE